MSTVYVVGLGPGAEEQMTVRAQKVLEHCPVLIGYNVYIDLVKEQFPDKIFLSTPMRKEPERCRMAFEEAEKGQDVAMICSGDAGVYGMAGLIFEIGKEYPSIQIEVVPGITAASGGAAVLGAPLMHDFAVISLSDLLTPWETIESVCMRQEWLILSSAFTIRQVRSAQIICRKPVIYCFSTEMWEISAVM